MMKIGVYGQEIKEEQIEWLVPIFQFLESKECEVILEDRYSKLVKLFEISPNTYKTFNSREDIDSSYNFMLGLGGDGTMLHLASFIGDTGVPMVGINLGRLGFLSNIKKESAIAGLEEIFNNECSVSVRSLLEIEFLDGRVIDYPYALNEVAVLRKGTSSMISAEAWLNGEYLNKYWADGVIVATPTGSTGYSLSCGGPIIYPESDNLVITPIAPHNLNMRPFIISAKDKVRFKMDNREGEYLLTFDYRTINVENDVEINIKRAPFNINLIYPSENSYLQTLRKKLFWGVDQRN